MFLRSCIGLAIALTVGGLVSQGATSPILSSSELAAIRGAAPKDHANVKEYPCQHPPACSMRGVTKCGDTITNEEGTTVTAAQACAEACDASESHRLCLANGSTYTTCSHYNEPNLCGKKQTGLVCGYDVVAVSCKCKGTAGATNTNCPATGIQAAGTCK